MKHAFENLPASLRHAFDLLSITALLGSLVSMLPAVASLLTVIWTAIRIYETPTVKGWLEVRRARRKGDAP